MFCKMDLIGKKNLISVDLDLTQFESLKSARDLLIAAHHAEECYDHIVENYCEFTLELMQKCVKHSLLSGPDRYFLEDVRRVANRRFMNVVTSTKKYIETVANKGYVITGDENVEREICRVKSEQYDGRLAYRAMEYLRTVAQHARQPLNGVALQSRWLEPFDDDSLGEHAIGIFLDIDALRPKDGKARRVVQELKGASSRIDIRGLIGGYLESIGEIHDKYRSLVKARLEEAETTYLSPIVDRFPDNYADVTGRVVKLDASRAICDEFFVSAGLVEYRKHLEDKNGKLSNLARRYVTSKIISAA